MLPTIQLDKMLTFRRLPEISGWVGYGLGAQEFIAPGGRVMHGHNGSVSGYNCSLRYSPSDDISVVVMSNDNRPSTHIISRELLVKAADHYLTLD